MSNTHLIISVLLLLAVVRTDGDCGLVQNGDLEQEDGDWRMRTAPSRLQYCSGGLYQCFNI